MPKKLKMITDYAPEKFTMLLDTLSQLFSDIFGGEYGYDYMVLMARRALNLEYSLEEKNPRNKLSPKSPQIMSNYGWFLCAEKYAQHYIDHGSFPLTVFIDDMLLHGRSIQNIMDGFTSLVIYHMDQMGTSYRRADVMEQLMLAIDIVVVAQNDTKLFLAREYEWKLNPLLMCDTAQGHMISQQIAQYFEQNGILNTSYILSAHHDEAIRLRSSREWKRIVSDLDGIHQELFVWKNPLLSDHVQVTVRYNVIGSTAYITPYVLHGDVQDIQTLFQTIARLAEQHGLHPFSEMSQKVCEDFPYQLLECYFQMADMFIGQVALSLFIRDTVQEDQELSFNTKKTARSFLPELEPKDLDNLTESLWSSNELINLCNALSQDSILPEQIQTGISPVKEPKARQLFKDAYLIASDVVWKQAIKSEIDVVQRTNSPLYCEHANIVAWEKSVSNWASDEREMDIERFFAQSIHAANRWPDCEELTQTPDFLISSMFRLFDGDFASLRVKVVRGAQGKPTAKLVVRHTELSFSLYSQRCKVFWESLDNLFWNCRRNDIGYKEAVKQFIRNIEADSETMQLIQKCGFDIKRCREDLSDIADDLKKNEWLYPAIMNWHFSLPKDDSITPCSSDTDRMLTSMLQQIRETELEWRLIKISGLLIRDDTESHYDGA